MLISDTYELKTVQNTSLVMELDPSGTGTFTYDLKFQDLMDSDKPKFKALAELLGDMPEILGTVKFEKFAAKVFYGPIVCLNNDEDGIVLKVANDEYLLEIENKQWSINGKSVILDRIENKRMVEGKETIVVTPTVKWFGESDAIDIGFLTKELMTQADYQTWTKAVMLGSVDALLPMLKKPGSGGNNASISFFMTPQFVEGKFPKDGFAIPVYEAKINTGKYGPELMLEVDCSGFPDTIMSLGWGNPKPVVPTNQISKLHFASYHTGFRNAEAMLERGERPSKTNPWYLAILGIGKSANEVPNHILVARNTGHFTVIQPKAVAEKKLQLLSSEQPEAETIDVGFEPVPLARRTPIKKVEN